jgi:glycosyltransferase involved in cell wall biosynthesis
LNITLSHPHGNPNSYQAANAFSERKWLRQFHTGIIDEEFLKKLTKHLPANANKKVVNRTRHTIPKSNQRSHYIWEAIYRAGRLIKPSGLSPRMSWYDLLYWGHDLQVSRSLNQGLDAVYAYEDGALKTFTSARKKGIQTIYELPAGYYIGVAEELSHISGSTSLSTRHRAEPCWKQKRKDAELELADLVVVASTWSMNTLRHNKKSRDKPIIIVPYGTPAHEVSFKEKSASGPFTVLFAGQIGLRKGVPYLFEAWKRLNLADAQLLLVGPLSLNSNYIAELPDNIKYLGAMPRIQLIEILQRVDLFAFPSLADGFGMVIGEAMACGVPVLTTVNTGGPELITDGREGWCIAPRNVESLIERIEWAYGHRDKLLEMGLMARRRAELWTWRDYRRALTAELSKHISISSNHDY